MDENIANEALGADSYKSAAKTKFSYDGAFKRFMEILSDEVVKKFLLYLFGLENKIDFSEKLVRLQQETHNDGKERICDLFYRIGNLYFCIEIQTTNDKQMALRVFEYSFRGAMLHGVKESSPGRIVIDFPEPAVIYLRSSKATPDKIAVELNFPGNTVSYEAVLKKLSDYTVEELFEQYAYPIMSFYPLNYEKDLHKKHTTELEKDFIEDINEIIAKIEEAVKDGILDPTTAQILIDTLRSLMNMVSEDGNLIADKEVLENMRQVDTLEIIDYVKMADMIRSEAEANGIKIGEANGIKIGEANGIKIGEANGIKIGEANGIAKERKKVIMNLYANDFEPLYIAKLMNITKEEVDEIINGGENHSESEISK